MTFQRIIISSLVLLLFSFESVTASLPNLQDQEVSNKELEQFAALYKQLRNIDKQTQLKMGQAVKKGGLQVQRFNDIRKAELNPDIKGNASPMEMRKYVKIEKELERIKAEKKKLVQQKIKTYGMTEKRYQDIITQIQSDLELQTKLRVLMEEED
ncbi:MAG: DUF4168 domain-containing protein [Bacteroidales bacterium]